MRPRGIQNHVLFNVGAPLAPAWWGEAAKALSEVGFPIALIGDSWARIEVPPGVVDIRNALAPASLYSAVRNATLIVTPLSKIALIAETQQTRMVLLVDEVEARYTGITDPNRVFPLVMPSPEELGLAVLKNYKR